MKKILINAMVCLIFFLVSITIWAMPVKNLISFGDSLSDGGNNPSAVLSIFKLLGDQCDPAHPCPPYVDGHFSNGPVAVEFLANSILPGGATNTNFFNYAIGGATTGIGNIADGGDTTNPGTIGLPGMTQEIGTYLANSGGSADSTALYFVWGGANDFLAGNSPIQAAQNIAGYVSTLAQVGAEHFLVPNLPGLSLTPLARDGEVVVPAKIFTTAFNTELVKQLNDVNTAFPVTDIIQFDTFSLINENIRNLADTGFTEAQNACLPSFSSAPCANPDEHVFWDELHPTTQTHTVIAAAFVKEVSTGTFPNTAPEPGISILLLAGLFALIVIPRGED